MPQSCEVVLLIVCTHIPLRCFVHCCRVDGLMWLNLDEDAWVDIGIDNKFYMRKMQLIMPQFVRSVVLLVQPFH